MNKFVHMMPIGTNSEKIIENIKSSGNPIHKAYLIIDREVDGCERAAVEVEEKLRPLVDLERLHVERKKIYDAVIRILKVIRAEFDDGNTVVINSCDADRYFTIACYIAAHISGAEFYMSENGSLRSIPVPPLKRINEEKVSIIKAIDNEGGEVDSINRLIDILEGKIEDQKKYMAQRARMSYHLNGLEEDGIVITKREGKNVRIILTELGKAYVVMFG